MSSRERPGRPRDSARFSITAQEWPEVKKHRAELARRHEQHGVGGAGNPHMRKTERA